MVETDRLHVVTTTSQLVLTFGFLHLNSRFSLIVSGRVEQGVRVRISGRILANQHGGFLQDTNLRGRWPDLVRLGHGCGGCCLVSLQCALFGSKSLFLLKAEALAQDRGLAGPSIDFL